MVSRSLPVELWQFVFRFATCTPNLFDTSLKSPFDEVDATCPPSGVQRNIAVKIALSMVSKTWRSIALEFLFESLSLHLAALNQLVDEAEESSSFDNIERLFRHVRYMNVKSADRPFIRNSLPPVRCEPLLRVLQHSPNLSVFRFTAGIWHDIPSSFGSTLLSYCGHSLQSLSLEMSKVPSGFFDLLVATAPRLQELTLNVPDMVLNPSNAAFISLHSLHAKYNCTMDGGAHH